MAQALLLLLTISTFLMLPSCPCRGIHSEFKERKEGNCCPCPGTWAPFSKVTHSFPQSEWLSVSLLYTDMPSPSPGTFVIPIVSQMRGKK